MDNLTKKSRGKYWTGKKRPEMSGALHPMWKGGVTSENMLIRRSSQYKNWSRSCMERDGFRCKKCGLGGRLEVHHIKSFCEHPLLRLDLNNGITLCVSCHKGVPRIIPSRRFSEEHKKKLSEAAKKRWSVPSPSNKPPPRNSPETLKIISQKLRGKVSWCKGLTKETHPSIARRAKMASERMMGKKGKDSPVWQRWHPEDHVTVTPLHEPL